MKINIAFLFAAALLLLTSCGDEESSQLRPFATPPSYIDAAPDAQVDTSEDVDQDQAEDLHVGIGMPPIRQELVLRDSRGEIVQRSAQASLDVTNPGTPQRPRWSAVTYQPTGDADTIWAARPVSLAYALDTGRAMSSPYVGRPIYVNGDCLEGNLVVPISQAYTFAAYIYTDGKGGQIRRVTRGGTPLTLNNGLRLVTLNEGGACVSIDDRAIPQGYVYTYTDPMPESWAILPGLAPYTVSVEEALD